MTPKKKEQMLDNNLRLYVKNSDMAETCKDISGLIDIHEIWNINISGDNGEVVHTIDKESFVDILRMARCSYENSMQCNRDNIKNLMFDEAMEK